MTGMISKIISLVKRTREEPIDLSDQVAPYIGGRAMNCIANSAYERWGHIDKRLSVGEFLGVMRNYSDKDMLKWPNMGKVTISRCRQAEKMLIKRIKK